MFLRRPLSKLFFAVPLMLIAAQLSAHSLIAQAQAGVGGSNASPVTFRVDPPLDDAPVVISEVRIDDKVVPLNEPVSVPPDWLHHMMVVVRNLSSKNVVRGGVQVSFPESGRGTHGDPIEADGSTLGRYPSEALFRPDGTALSYVEPNNPISVAPGATLNFPLQNPRIDVLPIATQRAGRISKVTVQLQTFYFDNGSRWSAGIFSVPTDQPGRWKIITADEFRTLTLQSGR